MAPSETGALFYARTARVYPCLHRMNTVQILAGIALVLAVVGIIRPNWPLVPVSVILLAVAVLLKA